MRATGSRRRPGAIASPGILALVTLATLGLAPGCTFSDGDWFATLAPSLRAAWVAAPDREAGEGWQRLSNDYQVRVDAAELQLGDVALLGGATGAPGGPTRFDPANPPAGYTLCHNGHCHASDGRLVPYAEIEAQLAGGGSAGLSPVVHLVAGGPFDLTVASERALACRPGCGLGLTRLLRVAAPIERLHLEGAVRDAPGGGRLAAELRWRWTFAGGGDAGAAAPALESALDLPADREHDPDVTLRLTLALGAGLLDGVDFAALTPVDGVIDLALPVNQAGRTQALANLGEKAFLTAAVARD